LDPLIFSYVEIELPLTFETITLEQLCEDVRQKMMKRGARETFMLKGHSIVAMKCRSSKSECMDHILTIPQTDISVLQDNDVLETVIVCKPSSKRLNRCTESKHSRNRRPHVEDFDFVKVIGRGGFSNVFMIRKKDTGKIFALKCLKKDLVKSHSKVRHVMNERLILSQIVHPFIVKMNWAFQSVI